MHIYNIYMFSFRHHNFIDICFHRLCRVSPETFRCVSMSKLHQHIYSIHTHKRDLYIFLRNWIEDKSTRRRCKSNSVTSQCTLCWLLEVFNWHIARIVILPPIPIICEVTLKLSLIECLNWKFHQMISVRSVSLKDKTPFFYYQLGPVPPYGRRT